MVRCVQPPVYMALFRLGSTVLCISLVWCVVQSVFFSHDVRGPAASQAITRLKEGELS